MKVNTTLNIFTDLLRNKNYHMAAVIYAARSSEFLGEFDIILESFDLVKFKESLCLLEGYEHLTDRYIYNL